MTILSALLVAIALNLMIVVGRFDYKYPKTSKPNILLMVLDDVGWGDISHGTSEYATPNIDNVIETGIELTQFYSHPTCTATRSALLTGQYAFKIGMQDINTAGEGTTVHIPFDAPTIAELLKPLGYRNELIGKWHVGYASWDMTPTGRGFDNHYGYFLNSQHWYNHTAIRNKADPGTPFDFRGYDLWDNRDAAWSDFGKYNADLYYDRFDRVVNDYYDEKMYNYGGDHDALFMYMAFSTVHTPILVPPQNSSQCQHIPNEKRRVYCNQMVYMDNIIGKMIKLYKDLKLWDDTLLLLTTDNGALPFISPDAAEVTKSYGCNMPYRAGKATGYEGGVRVFGAINGGKNILPRSVRGESSNILSHVIDIVPTVFDLLNEKLPENIPFDGVSMWKHLLYPKQCRHNEFRNTLYVNIEVNGTYATIIDGEYKYFQGKQCNQNGFVTPCIAYNGFYPCDQSGAFNRNEIAEEYLFHRYKDPKEMSNIAYLYPDLVAKYKNMIQDFVDNKGYMQQQDNTIYPEADPDYPGQDGAWTPWL